MCDLPFPCNGRKLLPQARLASARPPTPRDQKLPRTGKSHSRPAPSRSGRTDCGSRGSTARRSLCVPLPADRPGIWTSNLDIGLELRRKLRGCSPGRKNPRHQRAQIALAGDLPQSKGTVEPRIGWDPEENDVNLRDPILDNTPVSNHEAVLPRLRGCSADQRVALFVSDPRLWPFVTFLRGWRMHILSPWGLRT